MRRTTPIPPLGPYPHLELYGHVGRAANIRSTKITKNSVEITMPSPTFQVCDPSRDATDFNDGRT